MLTVEQVSSPTWIEKVVEIYHSNDQDPKAVYSISNDTLFYTNIVKHYEVDVLLSDLVQYNLTRNDFLAIRRENHLKTFTDFKFNTLKSLAFG